MLLHQIILFSENLSKCPEEKHGHFFQHPTLCNKYYHCSHSTLFLQDCPADLEFNPDKCSCDYPEGRCKESIMCHTPLEKLKECQGMALIRKE